MNGVVAAPTIAAEPFCRLHYDSTSIPPPTVPPMAANAAATVTGGAMTSKRANAPADSSASSPLDVSFLNRRPRKPCHRRTLRRTPARIRSAASTGLKAASLTLPLSRASGRTPGEPILTIRAATQAVIHCPELHEGHRRGGTGQRPGDPGEMPESPAAVQNGGTARVLPGLPVTQRHTAIPYLEADFPMRRDWGCRALSRSLA